MNRLLSSPEELLCNPLKTRFANEQAIISLVYDGTKWSYPYDNSYSDLIYTLFGSGFFDNKYQTAIKNKQKILSIKGTCLWSSELGFVYVCVKDGQVREHRILKTARSDSKWGRVLREILVPELERKGVTPVFCKDITKGMEFLDSTPMLDSLEEIEEYKASLLGESLDLTKNSADELIKLYEQV